MIKAALLISLALSSTCACAAEMNKWSYFNERTPSGTPVCSLVTAPTSGSTARNIAIKSIGGYDHLNITLFKDSWKIPQGKSLNATVDFMDDQPLTVDAYGDGKILDLALPKEATAVFIGLLRDSKQIRISFPSGSEQPWTASLKGAQPLLKKFVSCALDQEHTQPF